MIPPLTEVAAEHVRTVLWLPTDAELLPAGQVLVLVENYVHVLNRSDLQQRVCEYLPSSSCFLQRLQQLDEVFVACLGDVNSVLDVFLQLVKSH